MSEVPLYGVSWEPIVVDGVCLDRMVRRKTDETSVWIDGEWIQIASHPVQKITNISTPVTIFRDDGNG